MPKECCAGLFLKLGLDNERRIRFQPSPQESIRYQNEWHLCSSVESRPEVLGGAWVFLGTRVPVSALFENLKDGVTVNEFVELFPGVNLLHARSVLDHAAKSAMAVKSIEKSCLIKL